MKKLFITFLAMLYLGVSSGATLHYQYCMGRLIEVTLGHGEIKKCHTCGMERKAEAGKKCCTDKHQQFKSDKSGAVTYGQLSLGTSAVILQPASSFISNPSNSIPLTAQFPISKAPPSSEVPVFLRNCIFRI